MGKRKLCYAIPLKCGNCKKHFMTTDSKYVNTLPSEEQIKMEFVTAKGNGSHISLLCLLRSGLTVAQVEKYVKCEVYEHYLMLKEKYIHLWDKATFILRLCYYVYGYMYILYFNNYKFCNIYNYIYIYTVMYMTHTCMYTFLGEGSLWCPNS